MIFYAYTAAALALLVVVWLFLTTPHGPDGEGPLQIFFLWAFRTFGTPARDIQKFKNGANDLYLRRFYVTPRWLARFLERRTWWKWPTKIFIHHILRSDDDRDLHTHPWAFASLILWGSYREQILDGWRWRFSDGTRTGAVKAPPPTMGHRDGSWEPMISNRVSSAGSFLNNPASHTHRVEIIRPVWSLVFVCGAEQMWGFWTQDASPAKRPVFVPWRKYLGIPEERDAEEDVIRVGVTAPDSWVGPLTFDRSEEVTKRENMKDVLARSADLLDAPDVTVVTTYEGLRETARRIAAAVERKGE